MDVFFGNFSFSRCFSIRPRPLGVAGPGTVAVVSEGAEVTNVVGSSPVVSGGAVVTLGVGLPAHSRPVALSAQAPFLPHGAEGTTFGGAPGAARRSGETRESELGSRVVMVVMRVDASQVAYEYEVMSAATCKILGREVGCFLRWRSSGRATERELRHAFSKA